MKQYWHGRASVLVVIVGLVLMAGGGPALAQAPSTSASASSAAAATGSDPAKVKGGPQDRAADKKHSAPKRTVIRRVHDEGLDVRGRLTRSSARFTLSGRPRTTYRARLGGFGSLQPVRRSATVRTDRQGHATLVVGTRRVAGRTGAVTVRLRSRVSGEVRTLSTSRWQRLTGDGGSVQADTRIAALVKAIRAEHPTGAARDRALDRLSKAPASAVTIRPRMAAAAVAADEVEVRGRITWTDFAGNEVPARHVSVAVTDRSGVFGAQLMGIVETDNNGEYTLTFDPSMDSIDEIDVQVEVSAENADSARVTNPLLGDTYHQFAFADDVRIGGSVDVDYQAPNDTEFGQAFAIHDALWTGHLYAGLAGGGNEDQVSVLFPFGDDDAAAVSGNIMRVGAFEWSSWDVLNHEYGHWFDNQHDMIDSPGGRHCVDANLATEQCRDEAGRGKDEGTRLAFSEGFASYYSESSAHDAAVPWQLADTLGDGTDVRVGNHTYDDVITDFDGATDLSVSFPVTGSDSRFVGEDNEASVAGILWNLSSGHRVGPNVEDIELGARYTMDLLRESGASRLDTFLDHIWSANGNHRLTGSEPERGLGCLLADAEVAPYRLVAAGDVTATDPPALSWQPGNQGDFENTRFVVEAFAPGEALPYFTSAQLADTSWTPTGRDWSRVAGGRDGTVHLRVTGWQDDGPATGPYRGCLTPIDLDDSSVLNKAGCQEVTLPANDDGSTGAVPLPFPVNFFGTTYTDTFVNNNGNVTFDAPMGTFTPFTLDASTPPIIAPFFADIDTRGSGSAETTYSYGSTTHQGHQAFCVNWLNVGYYAAHWDKLNSAQLLLVDRSDQGPGDFDIVFNYGHVTWETGDASGGFGGFGGTPAAVGFSSGNGNEGSFFQMPGSLTTGAFVDGGPHALSTGFNTPARTPGRFVYQVRNGATGNSATGVVGTVTSGGLPAVGAIVQVCPAAGGQCVFQTRAGADGGYSAVGITPGAYVVSAYPPGGLNARPVSAEATVEDRNRTRIDLELAGIDGTPPGTTIGPVVGSGTMPMVNWNDALTLRTTGCVGGSATYSVLSLESGTMGQTLAEGQLSGGADGTYTASIPPLSPAHGTAEVSILIQCPGAADQTRSFNIYIDPSGVIVDRRGDPVVGATVTLESSPTTEGPFTVVPDGSDVMSPANRQNPMSSSATGAFGWDVVAGYYRVRASKEGCTAPGGGTEVTTDVLTIPPPVIDLRLVLDCPRPVDDVPPVIVAPDVELEGNTTGGYSGSVPGVSATDEGTPDDQVVLTSDAPQVLPQGRTVVTWTATDPAGNRATAVQHVTVVDTTAPVVTCPPDVRAPHSASPALGVPTVTDVVDAAPTARPEVPAVWPLGRTVVTWTASDASGNTATCAQSVTLSVPVTQTVSGGDGFSLALLDDGTVRAWGVGALGQLGRGSTEASLRPVGVAGLTEVRSVRAGGLHSLALRQDGSVWAWGDNSWGQLGDGTTTRRLAPVRVSGLPPIKAIGVGQLHSLAVGLDGSVWAWGASGQGQVGGTTAARVLRPARVPELSGITVVAGGLHHSVARRDDGTVWTWGGGYAGQLGDGTTSRRLTPVRVPGLSQVTTVAAGALHTVAVTQGGSAFVWGDNTLGQLGDGSTTRRTSPVRLSGIDTVAQVTAGAASTYLRLRDGRVLASGSNALGQLGDGTTVNRRTPTVVPGLVVADLAAGATHVVAGLDGGTARTWGSNLFGELGDAPARAGRPRSPSWT